MSFERRCASRVFTDRMIIFPSVVNKNKWKRILALVSCHSLCWHSVLEMIRSMLRADKVRLFTSVFAIWPDSSGYGEEAARWLYQDIREAASAAQMFCTQILRGVTKNSVFWFVLLKLRLVCRSSVKGECQQCWFAAPQTDFDSFWALKWHTQYKAWEEHKVELSPASSLETK